MTSKELVKNTLNGTNPERAPRQVCLIKWAWIHNEKWVKKYLEMYPDDIVLPAVEYEKPFARMKGDQYETGEYIDAWGSIFTNIQRGVIGEVKTPIIQEDDWSDAVKNVHVPEELLAFDIDKVNAWCAKSEKYIFGGSNPAPFEQAQLLRGTENLYMDLSDPPVKMLEFMDIMHDFYCRWTAKWAQTDVDALLIQDDWGCQRSMLIDPKLWKKLFMPRYREYIDIAHKAGKKVFMHSDGYILDILPSLIDIGLDAINSQIFCMGVENLRQFRGKITWWGEVDRQYILNRGTIREVEDAVKLVYDNLWKDGYCIAQCEFGTGSKPQNVFAMYETWNRLTSGKDYVTQDIPDL